MRLPGSAAEPALEALPFFVPGRRDQPTLPDVTAPAHLEWRIPSPHLWRRLSRLLRHWARSGRSRPSSTFHKPECPSSLTFLAPWHWPSWQHPVETSPSDLRPASVRPSLKPSSPQPASLLR